MSNTFDDQLTASARRLRRQSESHLSVPETIVIPQKRTRYWGWIATPAAAAVGLLIGLFIHRPAERQDNLSVPETIVIPQKRTRYWGWIATPAAAAVGLLIGLFIHRPAERQDNFSVPVVVAADNSGHSIVEDGTDYSLLVSL